MNAILLTCSLFVGQADPEPVKPGFHAHKLEHDGVKREYLVHIPTNYDPAKATPVVLVLHGATMDGKLMTHFTGFHETGEKHGFISVFPSGRFFTWNAGAFPGSLVGKKVDDVAFLGKVLDEVGKSFNVDSKRVYATGLSNGAMMCYRLASEMSDRIVAIAPVAGTCSLEKMQCKRPVPVIHFHGTKDILVPYGDPKKEVKKGVFLFKTVDDSLKPFIELNECGMEETTEIPTKNDRIKIVCRRHPGKNGCDVVLYKMEGGGHVWPGSEANPAFLGPVPLDLNANELIWEFFKNHSLR